MTISVECPNQDCSTPYSVGTEDFESESESSGSHTTQYLYRGTAVCPDCEREVDVEVISDILDDTGEVLSQDVSVS
ncbi:hypothetical protein [Pseudoalteromonas sp. Of7M-16]|uniref:hypothetical protein n=1 Tax=Pseudoalteromonas sp. Of7M-16 TaxID=2917756 RepID=UPI001EF68095|nr:hypothetical protein [Pseudoalteromonas sp. Of7M-16]MCG7549030.1 hypothetical protein [Pseudoalteromonas sp. Of7M-16]